MREELLTADEAAVLLRVSTKTVLRQIRSGQLRASKVGRSWRIRSGDLPCRSGVAGDDVTYLDDNASSPIAPGVVDAMSEVWAEVIGNASSAHAVGRRSWARIEESREQLAALVAARPAEIIFTSGATESNNLVLRGLARGGRAMAISAGEHDSVKRVAEHVSARDSTRLVTIGLVPDGRIDLDQLQASLADGDIGLVSVVAANSETGVLNPIADIAQLVRESGALFHCDATQWIGRLPWSMSEMGVDAISLSAHKMNGPHGVGAVVARRPVLRALEPTQLGGGHEGGLRSGSYNVPGIVGLGVAATLAAHTADAERLAALRDRLVDRLRGAGGLTVNGEAASRLPNTANVRFDGAQADAVLARCPTVAASLGSACHAGTIEPSATLLAMGLTRNQAAEAIRVSVTRFTSSADIDRAAAQMVRAVQQVRALQQVA